MLNRLLLALAVLATGCTTWSHPAKGQREYNSDKTRCWREADQVGGDYWPRYHAFERCMEERGWKPS